ncbi:MAG: hrpB [Acidimicrobiaceae bacterium]|nr:hrpB [Acidimicrobiaceae bacterium]
MARALPHPAATGLPVEEVLPELRAALAHGGAAVLQAEPGAGKTTLVPLRLLGEPWLCDGRIVVLEPRRVAARAAAARMAALLGEEVGATVGYVTRDDRRVGRTTRVEVVTDGILTRRLQRDPSLAGTALVVFDEFHERHLQADLGLALTLDAREGLRPDLRVLVMSATLETGPVSALLGGAPVVMSRGRSFPIELRWRPGRPGGALAPSVAAAIMGALERDPGDVLSFLPGVGEIRAVAGALGAVPGVEILALHGGLSAVEQDRALRSGHSRRVVLATDLAETSVTVEGVGVVVDAGLARRPSYDPASGLTRLRTVLASRASADQRAGRAGRLGPGVAYRLWSEAEHTARRAWPDPEITTVDLAALALELSVWGASDGSLRWLDPPPPAALATARQLLEVLGALADGRPTSLGRQLVELPVHPRLARMLLAAPGPERRTAGLLAALLSERDIYRRSKYDEAITADVATRLAVLRRDRGEDRMLVDGAAVAAVRRRGDELVRRVERALRGGGSATASPIVTARSEADGAQDGGWLLAEAYPDRIAQSRGGGRYRLRQGGGAVLPDHDPLATADWLVAAEVEGPAGGIGRADGRIRLAAALDRADVEHIGGDAVRTAVRLEWDERLDDLRATTERLLDALVLDTVRGPAPAGPATTAALVARAVATQLSTLHWTPGVRSLQARAAWARRELDENWPDVSDAALAAGAAEWLTPLLRGGRGRSDLARVDPSVAIRRALGGRRAELDGLLPSTLDLPTGRKVPIDYSGDRPRVSVKVQDLFGIAVHPAVAGGRVPLTLELLSPAGRPIQVTADLPGFWAGSWREVRREMAARYPKHSWPEDPARPSPPTGRSGAPRPLGGTRRAHGRPGR